MINGLKDRLKPDEVFRQRLREAKKFLNGTNWRTIFLERNPSWNNATDLNYVQRVYVYRTTDVFVTEELEAIAGEFKAKRESLCDKTQPTDV